MYRFSLFTVLLAIYSMACTDPKKSEQPAMTDQQISDLSVDAKLNVDMSQKDQGQMVDITIDQAIVDQSMLEIDQAVVEDMALPLDQFTGSWDELYPPEAYANQPAPENRLFAGVSEKSIGFPVGSGTVGYGPKPGLVTPFTSVYSGTNIQHSQLSAKALVLRQDHHSVALVKLDTVGVWQDFIIDIQNHLRSIGRGDLAEGLIIGATHTHGSGGRAFKHPIGEIAVGSFSPAFYTRLRSAVLDSILEADRIAEPAKIGYKTIQVPHLHNDRRCEDGEFKDDSMGVLKVTKDNDELMAVMLNYGMHGTIFNNDSGVLTSDAPGAVEQGIENALAKYVPVLYFQSWGGDMAPNVPVDQVMLGAGDDLSLDYTSLEAIASHAAQVVIPALEEMEMKAVIDIKVKTVRFPLSNELINPDGSFDRYPYGGLFCFPESANDNCGPDARVFTSDDLTCVPIPRANSITWTQITALQLGDLGFVTLPGEPLTDIATELRARAKELMGMNQVWIIGYSQGHLAYLVHKDDFFLAGYESTATLFGPGFGVYLIERGVEIANKLMNPDAPLSFAPIALPDIYQSEDTAFSFEQSLDPAQWTGAPEIIRGENAVKGIVKASFIGGDPAIDLPLVWLEKEELVDGNPVWQSYLQHSQIKWKSEDGMILLSLQPDPPYEEALFLDARRFYWTVQMPLQRKINTSVGQLPAGRYRFVAEGKQPNAYLIYSDAFDIGE